MNDDRRAITEISQPKDRADQLTLWMKCIGGISGKFIVVDIQLTFARSNTGETTLFPFYGLTLLRLVANDRTIHFEISFAIDLLDLNAIRRMGPKTIHGDRE